MDAQQALADLTEISSQIRAAVVFDDKGKVAGSTLTDSERADELARGAAELLAVADGVKTGEGTELTQLEAATDEGSVFVVRQGKTRIAATTGVDPTVGLVFYDLKSALRNMEQKPAPARKRAAAAKRPVRASGPGEAASGEPGGSPGTKKAQGERTKKPAATKKTTSSTARKPTTRTKKDAS
jgi:predicted regulator of Ras-like GTPase activity (Roadblock/LC7/MglB family)